VKLENQESFEEEELQQKNAALFHFCHNSIGKETLRFVKII